MLPGGLCLLFLLCDDDKNGSRINAWVMGYFSSLASVVLRIVEVGLPIVVFGGRCRRPWPSAGAGGGRPSGEVRKPVGSADRPG